MDRLLRLGLASFLCGSFLFPAAQAAKTIPLSMRTDINAFIAVQAKQNHFKRKQLAELFDKVKLLPEVIYSISKPYEAKPWYEYEKLFITEPRIDQGVKFWKNHEKDLQRASKKYGVPIPIIIAILGVETIYGQQQGGYRVIDSLTTLAFNYPKRAPFFQKELREFLLLTRKEKIDPLEPKGSYAGAIGQPQFMPSSYRQYAVDFSGDGKKDLVNNDSDVIGSVANYFKQHGWVPGGMIAVPATVKGTRYKVLLRNQKRHHTSYKATHSLRDLQRYGVTPTKKIKNTKQKSLLIDLQADDNKTLYYLTFHNFYVITRYNSSKLYAMAVLELSQEIQAAYDKAKSKS